VTFPRRARLVRVPLGGGPEASEAPLLVRGDSHPVALTGLVASEPLYVAPQDADPFALLDVQPSLDDGDEEGDAVGGGWFGYLGYGLGALVERVPAPPPRPVPLPLFAMSFYDHLLRLDSAGQWWFEALWSDERDAVLQARLHELRRRLSEPVSSEPASAGTFSIAPPGAAGHVEAVAACRERIAAGEIFQANLCLRLEGRFSGDPLDLFARGARALSPRHAAFVAGPWGAVCSMSPELFLRRRGREVVTEPIKGTAPRDTPSAALAASAKNRAENVMIVDLMRNDLGRVCEYGSVSVSELAQPRPAPGVWHLVSTVSGTLRPEVGDADLLRASFPPGSVTGAPKIQTMRVIAELEATGREAYTGAIGYASPVAGLELNVAIRTLEMTGDRIWLGAGGGIVADSDPAAELEECLVKARPVVEAVGGCIAASAPPAPRGDRAAFAFDGDAGRPDASEGVFSTMLVRDGQVADLDVHLARFRASVRLLYGDDAGEELAEALRRAASGHELARLRVVFAPGGGPGVELEPLGALPGPEPLRLAPVVLPGGLGAHKWRDRRLLSSLEGRLGAVPLLVDLDGSVLEAAHANVFAVEGDALVTPPLDGRLLAGTVRARLLADPPAGLTAREEPLTLARLAAADEIVLTSAIRGVHPGVLGCVDRTAGGGGRRARQAVGAR